MRAGESNAQCSSQRVSRNELVLLLRDPRTTVLDCRKDGPAIKGAFRVRLPTVLLRRLGAGTLPPTSINSSLAANRDVVVVTESICSGSLADQVQALLNRNGFRVRFFIGDLEKLIAGHQELAEECREEHSSCDVGTLNLDGLQLNNEDVDSEDSLSSRGKFRSADFPVQILPYLYLGNADTAANRELLDRYNIRHIINVTRDLANSFESDGQFSYLQIAVDDTCSHNLAQHFPEAISFIEQAVRVGGAVLVHCVAGISRSVTVCLAYLMHARRSTLDEAFDLVHKRNALIAPSFHFMGQLSEFERQLTHRRLPDPTVSSSSSSSSASPSSDL